MIRFRRSNDKGAPTPEEISFLRSAQPHPAVRALAGLALLLGGALYVAARTTTLRFFGWAKALGLGGAVDTAREALAPMSVGLPEMVVWSLPFALWVLASTLLLRGTRWVGVPLVVAVASELGQLVGLVPGVFDPVDLAAVVGAGALAMVGSASTETTRMRPLAIVVVFALLAAGTNEPEQKKAEREKKEAENLKQLDAYAGKLQAIHDAIAKLDLEQLRAKTCKSVKVELPKDTTGLRTVAHSFLARFGKDKSAWTKNEGHWAFLTEPTFAGHFEKHADDRTAYSIKDTAKRVQETFLPEKYLVVLAPLNAVPPKMGKKSFEGGDWLGWVFLADQQTGELACQVQIRVGSSKSIDFGGMLDSDDPEKEMFEDFQDNFESAINQVLPNGVKVTGNYGSLLR